MIAILALIYASFYFVFFGKGIVRKSARNISVFVGVGVVLVGAIVIMWWTFAPTTNDGRVFQFIQPIVPNVAGPVTEVPVQPLVPVKKGDLLFRIDPVPFQAGVDQIEASIRQADAQRKLAEIQTQRAQKLVKSSAVAQVDLDTWTANRDAAVASIAALSAQLQYAKWQLEQTTVLAPNDGYVVNMQVRPGYRVTTVPLRPAMTFVLTELNEVLASLSQSSARRVKPGDAVEVVFPARPGEVYTGMVKAIILATGEAQIQQSGDIPVLSGAPIQGRRPVRIVLDDPSVLLEVGQGGQSFVAFYTDSGKPFQIITRVVVRMQAWLGFLTNPTG